jgi:hypothetical protein
MLALLCHEAGFVVAGLQTGAFSLAPLCLNRREKKQPEGRPLQRTEPVRHP